MKKKHFFIEDLNTQMNQRAKGNKQRRIQPNWKHPMTVAETERKGYENTYTDKRIGEGWNKCKLWRKRRMWMNEWKKEYKGRKKVNAIFLFCRNRNIGVRVREEKLQQSIVASIKLLPLVFNQFLTEKINKKIAHRFTNFSYAYCLILIFWFLLKNYTILYVQYMIG